MQNLLAVLQAPAWIYPRFPPQVFSPAVPRVGAGLLEQIPACSDPILMGKAVPQPDPQDKAPGFLIIPPK